VDCCEYENQNFEFYKWRGISLLGNIKYVISSMELVTCGKINEGAGKNVNKKINDFTFVDIDLSLFTDDLTKELPSGVCVCVCVCARARLWLYLKRRTQQNNEESDTANGFIINFLYLILFGQLNEGEEMDLICNTVRK
jgi:hypothetical protein